METEEDRRAKQENDAARCSYQTAQVGHGDGRRKKSKTGEDGSYHTAQVGSGDRGRKKSKKGMDLFRFEFKNMFCFSWKELARPVMGTIFLVMVGKASPQGLKKRITV